jgi:hypothetical protein
MKLQCNPSLPLVVYNNELVTRLTRYAEVFLVTEPNLIEPGFIVSQRFGFHENFNSVDLTLTPPELGINHSDESVF